MPTKPVAKSTASPTAKRAAALKTEKSTPMTPAKPSALKPGKIASRETQEVKKPKRIEKSESSKTRKYSFPLLDAEHDALVALKHTLSEVTGGKVKKGELLRAAVRLLLKQPQTKVKAELAAIAAATDSEAG